MNVLLQSLIDIEMWNKAKWVATAYLVSDSPQDLPCLGLVFENADAGKQIFTDLIKRLGKEDTYEELRIAIVEGDVPGELAGYTVHISSEPHNTAKRAKDLGEEFDFGKAIIVSRIHRMNPDPKSPFLRNFKKAYSRHKQYLLIPLFGSKISKSAPVPHFDLSIKKKDVLFRRAEDIEPNDRDRVIFGEEK